MGIRFLGAVTAVATARAAPLQRIEVTSAGVRPVTIPEASGALTPEEAKVTLDTLRGNFNEAILYS